MVQPINPTSNTTVTRPQIEAELLMDTLARFVRRAVALIPLPPDDLRHLR
jgi:hypothetical protein